MSHAVELVVQVKQAYAVQMKENVFQDYKIAMPQHAGNQYAMEKSHQQKKFVMA